MTNSIQGNPMHHTAATFKKLPALTLSVKALMIAGALGLSPVLSAAQEDRMAFENQQMILQMFDELQRQIDELKQTTVRRDQFELLRTRVNQLGANVPVPIAPPPANANTQANRSTQAADPTPVAYEAAPAPRSKNRLPVLGSDDSEQPSSQRTSLSQLFGYGSASAADTMTGQPRPTPSPAPLTRAATTDSRSASGVPVNIAKAGVAASNPTGSAQYAQAQAALNSGVRESTSVGAPVMLSPSQPAQINRAAEPESTQASTYNPPIYNYGAAGATNNSSSGLNSRVSESQIEALRRQISALQRQQANLSAQGGNNQGLNSLKRDIAQLKQDQQQLASLDALPGQISLLSGLPAQVASLDSLPDQFDQLQTQVNDLNSSLENSLFQLADIKNSTEARFNEVRSQMQLANNFPTWMKWAMFGLGLLALIVGLTALLAASRQRKKINQLKDNLERDLLRVEDRMESVNPHAKPFDSAAFKQEIMALVASKMATPAATNQARASDLLAATSTPKGEVNTKRDPSDRSPYNLSNAIRKSSATEKAADTRVEGMTGAPKPLISETTNTPSQPVISGTAGAATLSSLTKVSDDDLDDYLPAKSEADEDFTIMDFEDEENPADLASPNLSGAASQARSANDTSIDFAGVNSDIKSPTPSKQQHDELDLSQEFSEAESDSVKSTDTLAMLSLLDHETKSERVKRDLVDQTAEWQLSSDQDQGESTPESAPSLAETQPSTDSVAVDEPVTKPLSTTSTSDTQAFGSPEPEDLSSPDEDGSAGYALPTSSDNTNNLDQREPTTPSEIPRPMRPKVAPRLQTAEDDQIARSLASATAASNPELASALMNRADQLTKAQQIQPALSDYNNLIKLFATSQNPQVRALVSSALLESTRLELTRTGTISASRLAQGKSFFSAEPQNRLFMESMELMRAAQRRDVSSEIKDLKNVYQNGPELDFVGLASWAQTLGGSAAKRVQEALEQFKDWSNAQTN